MSCRCNESRCSLMLQQAWLCSAARPVLEATKAWCCKQEPFLPPLTWRGWRTAAGCTSWGSPPQSPQPSPQRPSCLRKLIRKRQPEVKQEGHSAPANTLGSAAKGQLQHQQRSSDPKKQVRPWQGRSAPAAEHSLPILPARKRRCALMPAAFERTLSGVGQHQLSAKRAQQHTALQRPAGQHTGLCNVGARLPFAEIGLLTSQPPGAAGREPD